MQSVAQTHAWLNPQVSYVFVEAVYPWHGTFARPKCGLREHGLVKGSGSPAGEQIERKKDP